MHLRTVFQVVAVFLDHVIIFGRIQLKYILYFPVTSDFLLDKITTFLVPNPLIILNQVGKSLYAKAS